ncbi:MAG: hypothetical protein ACI8WB_005654 [Phenylobacterium sp.]|jgi:hypothetical protein
MIIFIATLVFFYFFAFIDRTYAPKPNALFLTAFCILCIFLTPDSISLDNPFADGPRLLAAVIFCLLGHGYEIYFRVTNKVEKILFNMVHTLLGLTLGCVIAFGTILMIFDHSNRLTLFVFSASTIALVLVFLIEHGFRYFVGLKKTPISPPDSAK